jgi:DNA polymerase-1
MIKIAMVNVDKALLSGGFRTRMLLQVHDELLFEAPQDEAAKINTSLRRTIPNALQLQHFRPFSA